MEDFIATFFLVAFQAEYKLGRTLSLMFFMLTERQYDFFFILSTTEKITAMITGIFSTNKRIVFMFLLLVSSVPRFIIADIFANVFLKIKNKQSKEKKFNACILFFTEYECYSIN